MAVISTLPALLSLGLFLPIDAQDIVFGGSGPSAGPGTDYQGCTTIGGPGVGQPCQFPFIYNDVARDGCITEADPEGKAWCSTRVDAEGRHVAGGDHWAHCDATCPLAPRGSGSGPPSSGLTVRITLVCILLK